MTDLELKRVLKVAKDKGCSKEELAFLKSEYNKRLERVYLQPDFSIDDDGDDYD